MSVTTFSSEQIVKALFTGDIITRPSNWYVSLHSGNPGMTGANEVGDANYARQSVAFTASQNGDFWQVTSDSDVTFPAADAAYDVLHVGIFDNNTGGTFIASFELPLARSIATGGVFSIPVGELVIDGRNL